MQNDDLNTFQYGASGSSYFFYQLSLTGDFFIKLKFNKSINYAMYHHFKPLNKQKIAWKNREVPPDNEGTAKATTRLRKVYANVNDIEKWDLYTGKKVFLYTDLRTQLRMAWFKKAFWFYDLPGHKWEIPQTYNGIKDVLNSNPNNLLLQIQQNNLLTREDVYSVKFNDIVTVDGLTKVFNDLGTKINQKNIDFVKYYISCHPDKLLEKCNIKKIP